MEAESSAPGARQDIAQQYTDEFRACQQELRVRLPHHMPRATDFIPQMGAIIDDLLKKGVAYEVNGNVYFEVAKFPEYGKLSGKKIDELESGARVAVNTEKRDPYSRCGRSTTSTRCSGRGRSRAAPPAAGVAHRVLSDVDALPRQAGRYPHRR